MNSYAFFILFHFISFHFILFGVDVFLNFFSLFENLLCFLSNGCFSCDIIVHNAYTVHVCVCAYDTCCVHVFNWEFHCFDANAYSNDAKPERHTKNQLKIVIFVIHFDCNLI